MQENKIVIQTYSTLFLKSSWGIQFGKKIVLRQIGNRVMMMNWLIINVVKDIVEYKEAFLLRCKEKCLNKCPAIEIFLMH